MKKPISPYRSPDSFKNLGQLLIVLLLIVICVYFLLYFLFNHFFIIEGSTLITLAGSLIVLYGTTSLGFITFWQNTQLQKANESFFQWQKNEKMPYVSANIINVRRPNLDLDTIWSKESSDTESDEDAILLDSIDLMSIYFTTEETKVFHGIPLKTYTDLTAASNKIPFQLLTLQNISQNPIGKAFFYCNDVNIDSFSLFPLQIREYYLFFSSEVPKAHFNFKLHLEEISGQKYEQTFSYSYNNLNKESTFVSTDSPKVQ